MKKSLLTFILLGGLYSGSLFAQEIRVQGNMLIVGYIESPFVGAGAGIEANMGDHFSLNVDANWGSQEEGSSLELRPAVNYYFGADHKGLFLGAAFKYINLNEKEEGVDLWEDNLYTLGFNLGFKALLSEKLTLGFTASPHVAVGGQQEGDVAGISAQLGLGYRF
ncbi:MAG: DUF3575 domain-containing protein [Saprospiraceae bacterium]|nr:DUF3575 domain-containing protein [Candidatus Opimibacter iunctus]